MSRQIGSIWSLVICLFTFSSNVISNNVTKQNGIRLGHLGEEVCMKELGCFPITEDFISLFHRPFNVFPDDRDTINTKCFLYTRKFPKESIPLIASDPSTFKYSQFNPANPTKIIIHGFMDSEFYGYWMLDMKDEFLLHDDYNVIIVDWTGGNNPPYFQATANTRVVAAEVVLVIKAFEKHFEAKPELFHIIGHSLGGHIAGYIGQKIKNLGRITGCDPAGPYFQGMPPSVRLDPTDANFVDVIHSDSTNYMFIGFGMTQSVGHVDFFPNNGRNQPGCQTDKYLSFILHGFKEGLRRFGACNHERSLDFLFSTINFRRIVPVAYQCSDWESFVAGKCTECGWDTSLCAVMGLRAEEYFPFKNDSESRNMYIKTSGFQPFWHKEVCMKELGCFAITDDFKSLIHRPINVLPHDRATINTKCLLYTRKNAKESHQLWASDPTTFEESHYNPANPTKFIVHGFMDSELYGPWMVDMKDEFLMHGDYNIIVVDWSGGNKPPYYQATSNTRVVAAEMALIVKALEKHFGAKREEFHIIGHSLGSHIAGYTGARLKTLGRITGCDPAEPYFQNMPPSVRLDPTDADYVDVIHSDATDIMFIGFGMSHPAGHVDFFPNNGRNQPGCKSAKFKSFITDGLNEGARRFASCNHQRSLDFFHHSINYRKVTPVGFECSSWKDFLDGKCADCGFDTKKCAIMGIRADEYKQFRNNSIQHQMYLQTSGKPPYWLYHYQISVKLFKPKSSFKDVKGTMEITLFGSRQDELFKVQDKTVDYYHGARYQYLVTTDKDLGEIKSVTLKWTSSSKNPIGILFKPKLFVEYVTVIPMNIVEASPRNMTNRAFCNKPESGISPRTIATLHRDNKCLK